MKEEISGLQKVSAWLCHRSKKRYKNYIASCMHALGIFKDSSSTMVAKLWLYFWERLHIHIVFSVQKLASYDTAVVFRKGAGIDQGYSREQRRTEHNVQNQLKRFKPVR